MVDGAGPRDDRARPCADQDSEGFALPAPARVDEVFATQRFAGCADGVDGVALAATGAVRPLRPGDLDDAFTAPGEVGAQSSAVASGALDGPAAGARGLRAPEVHQLPVPVRVGGDHGFADHGSNPGDGCSGQCVAVSVDTDDGVDGFG